MKCPVLNQIRSVFIPVSHIETARDWYCKLLNLPPDGEIHFGHIYVLPMQGGTNAVLDSKIFAPDHVFKVPAVQLFAERIDEAYDYMKRMNVEIITGIENGHWFNIKDPDGNVIMICS